MEQHGSYKPGINWSVARRWPTPEARAARREVLERLNAIVRAISAPGVVLTPGLARILDLTNDAIQALYDGE